MRLTLPAAVQVESSPTQSHTAGSCTVAPHAFAAIVVPCARNLTYRPSAGTVLPGVASTVLSPLRIRMMSFCGSTSTQYPCVGWDGLAPENDPFVRTATTPRISAVVDEQTTRQVTSQSATALIPDA